MRNMSQQLDSIVQDHISKYVVKSVKQKRCNHFRARIKLRSRKYRFLRSDILFVITKLQTSSNELISYCAERRMKQSCRIPIQIRIWVRRDKQCIAKRLQKNIHHNFLAALLLPDESMLFYSAQLNYTIFKANGRHLIFLMFSCNIQITQSQLARTLSSLLANLIKYSC